MSTPTRAQRNALGHVRATALEERDAAVQRIAAVLDRAGVAATLEALLEGLWRHAELALNFHPDRLLKDGRTVAEAMLDEGHYRSQFETGISNGSRTAFTGGDRDRWEERLFGGAYQQAGVTARERPRYGGLNLLRHGDGPAPRFGSCHLRLKPHCLARATFCFGDSHAGPKEVGTAEAFEPVLAALLEGAERHGAVLGRKGLDPRALIAHLSAPLPPRSPELGRALDDYVEAQVHADVLLAEDAEALVVDPSFRGTAIGTTLEALADRYGLALDWHRGFALAPAEVPADFRGPEIPPLATRLVRELGDGAALVDTALIGAAARSAVREPSRWADVGGVDEVLQQLKYLWHVLVAFG